MRVNKKKPPFVLGPGGLYTGLAMSGRAKLKLLRQMEIKILSPSYWMELLNFMKLL